MTMRNVDMAELRAQQDSLEKFALLDPMPKAPDYNGTRGRFWIVANKVMVQGLTDHDTCFVTSAIIEAPYANMHWHSVCLSIVDLREHAEPLGKAKITLPGATHEISVFSLNPSLPRHAILTGKAFGDAKLKTLFTGQLILGSDAEAREILLATARDVADAKLPPDKDYLKWWAARFGTANLKPGWDEFADKFIIEGEEIVVPLHPLPGETK